MTGGRLPIWAWLVQELDGRWGVIAAGSAGIGPIQLVSASEMVATKVMRPFAEIHRIRSEKPVKLVKFEGGVDVEVLD